MKRQFLSLKTWLVSGLLLTSSLVVAQTYPFPQNITYPFGLSPAARNSADAQAAYNSWKSTYVKSSCKAGTTLRVTFDDPGNSYITPASNGSVSEGIGYGLLLSAYFGDKTTFDGLWAYYVAWKDANGLMHWIINDGGGCAIKQANSATDADVDAAWALYVAHWQWGNGTTSQYLTDCKTLIAAIKAHEVESGTNVLKPGDAFGGSGSGNNDLINLSYFSPAYFTEFGNITNDNAFWNGVVTKNYALLNSAKNSSTGLVPDWCRGSDGGYPAAGAASYHAGGANFYYDAVRTPFRIGLDYLWHGTASALAYTKLINTWLGSIGAPGNLHTEYTTAGAAVDNYHNNTFVGCFSAATMATDLTAGQSLANSFYTDNKNTNPASAGAYFNASWKALSLLLQTGNFYLPPPDLCDAPFLSPSYDLCSNSPAKLDGGISGGTYTWKLNGTLIPGATSQSYSTTTPGTYEMSVTVPVNGKPCIRRASTVVNAATPTSDFIFAATGLSVQLTDQSSGGIATYAWSFPGATPSTASIPNPLVQYAGPGLKLITLKVTNACGQTSTKTAEVTIGNPNSTAGGWFVNNFSTPTNGANPDVFVSSKLSGGTNNPYITFDSLTSCKFVRVNVNASSGFYDPISLGFKNAGAAGNHDYPIDITDYPYARFRIKVNVAVDSIRIDLQDNTYKSTDWKPLFLKGERNADGTYKPIPVNTWFISTVDFTGRFYTGTSKTPINSTKIQQLQFLPYAANDNKANPSAKPRKNMVMDIDWALVGNKIFPAPDLSSMNSPVTVCSGKSVSIGIDTCIVEVDDVQWSGASTAITSPILVSTAGTYTLTATNFGGVSTKDVVVTVSQNSVASFAYTTPAVGTVAVTDGSLGPVSGWQWFKNPTGTVNTWNAATQIGSGQNPPTAPFTGIVEGDKICLRLASNLCYATVLTDRGYCQTISFLSLGLEDLNSTTTNVYPTLVEENLNILLGGNLSGSFNVTILDALGKTHHTSTIGTGLSTVNVATFPAGTYLLNIKQGDKTMTRKFIKQ
jgi:endo-1,4-beta-D-glucanase Y